LTENLVNAFLTIILFLVLNQSLFGNRFMEFGLVRNRISPSIVDLVCCR